jgi:hypothetical protein
MQTSSVVAIQETFFHDVGFSSLGKNIELTVERRE